MTKISENITTLTVETKKGIINLDFYGIYPNVTAKTLLTKYKDNIVKVECIDFKYFYDMKKALSELNMSLDDVKVFVFTNDNVIIKIDNSLVSLDLYSNKTDCIGYIESFKNLIICGNENNYKNCCNVLSTLMLQPLTTDTEHKIYNTINDMQQLIYREM